MRIKWMAQSVSGQVVGVVYEYERRRVTFGGYTRDLPIIEEFICGIFSREDIGARTQLIGKNKLRISLEWDKRGGFAGFKKRVEYQPGWIVSQVKSLGRLMR